jgi:effector-binding domain-containing protein
MRIIRIVIGILALLLLGYIILCSTGVNTTNIESRIKVEALPHRVYEQIGDLNNWSNWLPWAESNQMKIEVGPIARGKNASYNWTSKKGGGTLEVLETIPNVSIRTKINPERSESDYRGHWSLVPEGEGTYLTWKIDSDEKISFLKQGYYNYIVKPRMISDMDKGLEKIKSLSESSVDEKRKGYGNFIIEEETVEPRNYLIVRAIDNYANYDNFYNLTMKTLSERAENNEIDISGSPTVIIFDWDRQSNKIDLAGARIVSGFEGKEDLNMFSQPGGRIVYTDYYGPFVDPLNAHIAIGRYVEDNGLNVVMPCFFEYLVTSEDTNDSRKWHTRLSYFLVPSPN